MTERDVERFASKYLPVTESGCWVWIGHCNKAGYGAIQMRDGLKRAHKVIWEHLNGVVPQGLELDHLCRVRCCVNPDHLEAVTHDENMKRSIYGIRTHCEKGHEFTVSNTYYRVGGGRRCRECSRTYLKEYKREKRRANKQQRSQLVTVNGPSVPTN